MYFIDFVNGHRGVYIVSNVSCISLYLYRFVLIVFKIFIDNSMYLYKCNYTYIINFLS